MEHLASKYYYQKTGRQFFYNIMPIENIASVKALGILCFDAVRVLPHASIALTSVQKRRDKVIILNRLRLHQYANLYFTYNNPMLYKRKSEVGNLCILAISSTVLDIEGCVVTDQNAAADWVKFYDPIKGIEAIDFDKVFAKYWTHDDLYQTRLHRATKCAEVLVPEAVPYSYIAGAYVVDEEAKRKLEEKGFDKMIAVNKAVFYM